MTTAFRKTTVCLATLLVACSTGDAGEPGAGTEDASAAAEGHVAELPPGTWRSTSTEGTRVTLRAEPHPLEAGPVRLQLELDAAAAPSNLSVDLVSPGMPMHGIRRFDAEPAGPDGGYVVDLEIPMAGSWAVYVNLDDVGTDAAAFEFEVAGGEGAHDHGDVMMPPPDTAVP